jgi:hypothetical protein
VKEKMDEQEQVEYEQEGKRQREEHVKKVGQQLIEELQYILGPNLKKHKDLFKEKSCSIKSCLLRKGMMYG